MRLVTQRRVAAPQRRQYEVGNAGVRFGCNRQSDVWTAMQMQHHHHVGDDLRIAGGRAPRCMLDADDSYSALKKGG
jgi:hypothetical protein